MSRAFTSAAAVPTVHASKYLQQLCKHWSHNLTVEFTPDRGTVVFPRDLRGAAWASDGRLTMTAQPESLLCQLEAGEPAQLEALQGAVARHLDRFAFREAPLPFDWRDG